MQDIITPHNLYWVLGEQNLGPLEFYFAKALKQNGRNVNYLNIHNLYSPKLKKLSVYSHRLPRKYDNFFQKQYFNLINNTLIERYKDEKPAFIFIYNDCKILPETLKYFKKHGTKIIIFLGDDPNYLLPAKKTFLLNVMCADIIIIPDTGWIDGLKMLDIKNIIFSPIGTDTDIFFPIEPNEEQKRNFETDILFVGTGYYLNSWGIKRAVILNELCDLNFKLFGDDQWLELLPYFPKLKKNFINQTLSANQVNIACNCAKIYPIVINSSVTNGVPTRVFDCIASGIFIIAEYKKDFEQLFPNGEVISFKSKKELKDKTNYYLKNEHEMKDYIERARTVVLEKYTLNTLIKNILEQI